METYATPYDRAKAILEEVSTFALAQGYDLPSARYAQVGDVVRDCESVIVAVGSLVPDPSYDPVTCVYPRTATFLVEILRGCAVVFEQDGTTNHEALGEISERGGQDGQFLYDFAASVDGWSSKQSWSVAWGLTDGGLQVASLQLTIGIP